ncbi:outer membrane family protein [Helicobacter salomonis]|uniref:outer membrane family protein n=1 Tax=Helicobacter salomonis TaxID=56878 RepID=UPI000CF13D71|nr:outer membrane family protein [Helicobacter salomonis]
MQRRSCVSKQGASKTSLLAALGSLALATGVLNAYEFNAGGRKFNLEAFANQSASIGFNNSKIDEKTGTFPTERYATITGYLGLNMNLLPEKTTGHSLTAKIGGMVGGVLYDGTKSKPGGSIITDIFGDHSGFMDGYQFLSDDENFIMKNGDKKIAHNYVWSDIYIDYKYKDYFGFKGGRYQSSMGYRSGRTQGFEVFGGTKDLRVLWFSSFGRAFATGSYIKDWYAARTTYSGEYTKNSKGGWDRHGVPVYLGTHAVQVNYQWQKLSLEGFFYFSPKIFNAPGFRVAWDTDPNFSNRGFRSQTELLTFFPVYYPWMVINSEGQRKYKFGTPITQTGQSFAIKQRFDLNEFYLVGTFYKSFQNPNTYIGNMGNPVGVEFGGNSAWAGLDGPAIEADAVTGNLGYGGSHFKQTFNWQMVWQWTSAKVADAGRVSLFLEYNFNKFLSANVTIAYFGINTHKGYQENVNVSACVPSQERACKGGYQDRSALTTALVATF